MWLLFCLCSDTQPTKFWHIPNRRADRWSCLLRNNIENYYLTLGFTWTGYGKYRNRAEQASLLCRIVIIGGIKYEIIFGSALL